MADLTRTGLQPSAGHTVSNLKSTVEEVKAPFAPRSSSAVMPCESAPAGPPKPVGCPAETLKANVATCDGGTGVWAKAKAAAGKDPSVTVAAAAGGFGGHADTVGGGVVISPNPDCCGATQTLVFELANLGSKARFDDNARQAKAGELDREAYTRAYEQVEYDSGLSSVKAFKSCKDKWGCGKGAVARHGFIADAKDFDDYYANHLAKAHKDHYRDFWDKNLKSIYEKKHPTR